MEATLQAVPADARQRYQAARTIAALGAPFASFAAVQDALATGRPLARDLTLGQARSAADALKRLGLTLSIVPSGGVAPASPAAPVAKAAAPAPSGWRGPVQVEAEPEPRSLGSILTSVPALLLVAVVFGASLMKIQNPSTPAAMSTPAPAATLSQPAARGPNEPSLAVLARRALPSTVSLRCANSVGSGFFVAPELVLTNAHVLCGNGKPIRVISADGRGRDGTVLRSDERLDLGLVRVPGATDAPLPMGDAGALAVGERLMMIGSPVGLEFTVHDASVSNLSRPIFGVSYVQIAAKINPGNSGGPLIDAKGRVVAVVSLKHQGAEGIGLALPINYAYAPTGDLIPAPGEGGAASAGFESMLASAGESDREARKELGEIELRPLVTAASVDQYRRLVVTIVYPSRGPLGYQDFRFKLIAGGLNVCTLSAGVVDWKVVERKELPTGLDARARAWLDNLGFSVNLYQAGVPLMMSQCGSAVRPGTALELEGADPKASRIALTAGGNSGYGMGGR